MRPSRLGGADIDDKLILGRGLHGEVRRSLALQDVIRITGGEPMLVDVFGSAAGDEGAFVVHRGQICAAGKRNNQIVMDLGVGPAVTIRPQFGERANASTARSISGASRIFTGLTLKPSGEADCDNFAHGRLAKLISFDDFVD